MKTWYLLYCKPGQLLRAQMHLNRQHVNAFSPLGTIEKLLRGRRLLKQEPLFPNYLFIEIDPEEIHTTTISSTRGVSHFIRFGAQPAIVPQDVIDVLQGGNGEIMINKAPQSGDSVLITQGAFRGLQGIFIQPDGETRSMLLLNLLNKQVKYRIDNLDFQKSS